jgi:hypothetical protein
MGVLETPLVRILDQPLAPRTASRSDRTIGSEHERRSSVPKRRDDDR